MTTLKDIWPAMTLFYDYIMPFIEKEFSTHKPLLYSFLKVQSKDTKLLIIRKDFIWSSYNIHFVSLYIIIKYHHHHHHHHLPLIMQQSIWKLQHPLPSPRATHGLLIIIQAKGEGGRVGGDWTLPDWHWEIWTRSEDFPLEYMCYINEYIGV